jgi:hypothetical protein
MPLKVLARMYIAHPGEQMGIGCKDNDPEWRDGVKQLALVATEVHEGVLEALAVPQVVDFRLGTDNSMKLISASRVFSQNPKNLPTAGRFDVNNLPTAGRFDVTT